VTSNSTPNSLRVLLARPSQMAVSGASTGRHHFHQRLVAHGFGQAVFQRRHIDDPAQGVDRLGAGIEMHAAAFIAKHFHVAQCGGVDGSGQTRSEASSCLELVLSA
jgi:hypothetical protein